MLHYHKTGSGPAIVLIHGFPFDLHLWDAIVPALSRHFTVICPDLPGAGASALHTPLSVEYMATQIASLLNKEAITQAIIGGHSMGGYVALAFAEQFPHQLAGLAMIHSSALPDSAEKKAGRLKTIRLIQNGDEGKHAFLKAMAPGMYAASFSRAHPEAVQYIIERGMKIGTGALTAFQQAIMNRPDRQAIVRNIHAPVFWAIGNEDTAAPQTDTTPQILLPPVCEVQFYRPCGHCSMIEMPEKLAGDLIHFGRYIYDL